MNKKVVIIMFIAIIVLAGIGGGVYMAKQKEEKEQAAEEVKKDFWEKQKPRIELYFRHNFERINSFDYTDTDESPMGVSIYGYVNGNPEHEFAAYVSGYESEFNYMVAVTEEFSKVYKGVEDKKNVDEIIKAQKEDQ